MALGGFSGGPQETGSQAGPGGGRVGWEGWNSGQTAFSPGPPLRPSRAVSFTQRETQTRQVEWSDFLKFCVGGPVERCGGEGGGGDQAEPALWANGKEVGEAWVSPVGESGHQRGHP